jgi:hypothetical protein
MRGMDRMDMDTLPAALVGASRFAGIIVVDLMSAANHKNRMERMILPGIERAHMPPSTV